MSILYITYDGLLEPLGQSQVLAYLEKLSAWFPIHCISYEKDHDWDDTPRVEHVRSRVQQASIDWHPLRYHKRPSAAATAYDIAQGSVLAARLIRKHNLQIVHARSYVPSMIALAMQRATRTRYLFDMRGFWADERVDGGIWPRGRMYNVAKRCESAFLRRADHIVSLTHAGKDALQRWPGVDVRAPITVIPTCADLERFSPPAQWPQADAGFRVGYVGSVGTWYRFDEAVRAYKAIERVRQDATFVILNRGDHDFIRDQLATHGVEHFELKSATHDEVAAEMRRMQCAVFFIKKVFSKTASAPTRLAEFMGAGVPCVSNTGVGDMAKYLDGCGVAMDEYTDSAHQHAAEQIVAMAADASVRQRCVDVARSHFSLTEGVERYRAVYDTLV